MSIKKGPVEAGRRPRWLIGCALAVSAATAASVLAQAPVRRPRSPGRPSLILLTLDTTRADHLGSQGVHPGLTPHLDALAARGTRYARAVSPSPLTLPAHCSLLTGLDPPGHGVHDNGTAALPAGLPTLAKALSDRGYATAAFVASRVLDRRFGLERGFGTFDDRMAAERMGEYGYPERNAEAVTTAALAWAAGRPRSRPYFLWVHYYDPHAPYAAPGSGVSGTPSARYAAEISYMDREIGRLLKGLSADGGQTLVAAVGDHGEMLGEHGEAGHGVFLYRASLEVPLIITGPGVPPGTVIPGTVGTRALPSTLLKLSGFAKDSLAFGPSLPGLSVSEPVQNGPVYSETWLPATAYGWSPLKALSDDRWRFILAPRPELYDFVADPAEAKNLVSARPAERERMEQALARLDAAGPRVGAPPVKPDAELAESLASLGYHSGASGSRAGTIDPKDGIGMLAELEQAKQWAREGRAREAVARLDDLVRRSPGNVPFLVRLAVAQSAAGRAEAGLATLKYAVGLNPRLDFLHAHLADAYLEQGRLPEARAEYEVALELNPRFARAWLGLGEAAGRGGQAGAEVAVLRRAVAAGTDSAFVWTRLAELELDAGKTAAAARAAEEATRLVPELAQPWLVRGNVALKAGRVAEAVTLYDKAIALGLSDPQLRAHVERLRRRPGSGP
jgi:arylsulfatase A-like enzyme/predicted negative regulator of RcsB-dependent stress response